MSKIYFLMGKSSSGKDTIYNRLMSDDSVNLKTIVGYTTRPMRDMETEGKEYHFVSEEEMRKLEAEGKLIELRGYNTVHGMWYYFTVEDGQIDNGADDYLFIGTLESYEKVREYYGADRVVPIYICVDDGVRLMRALNREMKNESPKYAEMCRRFLTDEKDFSEENLERLDIKKRFINDDIEVCIAEIKEYINKP